MYICIYIYMCVCVCIYTAVNYRLDPNVPEFPPDTYEEAHTSKNRCANV